MMRNSELGSERKDPILHAEHGRLPRSAMAGTAASEACDIAEPCPFSGIHSISEILEIGVEDHGSRDVATHVFHDDPAVTAISADGEGCRR